MMICRDHNVETGRSGFEDIRLVHNALPECDMDAIDLSTRFFGSSLSSPVMIAAMTGGHPETLVVNQRLAEVAQHYGIAMGVGSQRAALEDSRLEDSFLVVRETAPDAFLCANLGIVQLRDHGPEWADRAVEMIDAQALCIHLNPLQEAIQPEGDHNSEGCLEALRELCSSCRYPVIVKETGCGISRETASLLWGAGVDAIDTGGLGGTSWSYVEKLRAENPAQEELGGVFSEWGIPTAVSLWEAARAGGPVIATGGLRSGIDLVKALHLGATLGGFALPLLQPAMESTEKLSMMIDALHTQMRVCMYLTGSANVQDLQNARSYITGITGEMIKRG